jgi:hypothetical protein
VDRQQIALFSHMSAPFPARAQPLSGQLGGNRRRRSQHLGSRFPAAFRPPAFASRVFLHPPGDCASLTVGLPAAVTGCLTP